ncbi:MAG: hypothetical protein K9M36_02585 [Candidatus Pacebacteria bacterium]|nr:hypothetical protein [Candidatus Paceibacterota bacterium]
MPLKIFEILRIKGQDLRRFIQKSYFFWVVFWLFVTSTFFSIIIWIYGKEIISLALYFYNLRPAGSVFVGIIGFFILVGILIFTINPIDKLKRQGLRSQPSWVFYTYWSLINTFIIYSLTSFTWQSREFWWNGNWSVFLVVSLMIILSKWIIESSGEKLDLSFTRFASGSTGIDNDKLNFKASAKNASNGLLNLSDDVNVVGLYGGLGFGKSSYARMILESLDENKALYTYISLTETNEAKDFSKLFSERWLDTLSERYPKIDITSHLPFMDSILRESGNGIISELLKAISTFNLGLIKTKSAFCDGFYSKKNFFTSSAIAKLFGNITEIKETMWVIMVDEIERAQFEEIYRLVEIIERFKNEGRSGLPIKLVFLFCISEPDLNNYLTAFSDSDPRARLLRTFFYDDPKSITHRIFIPTVGPEIKQEFILDLLNKVIERETLDVPKDVNPHAIGDPSRSFMNHKDAIEHTIAILKENSPRIISRITIALDFFYGAFRNHIGESQNNNIRFNDILTLEYIKIEYPYLIDFFTKTIHILINQAETNNMDSYFIKEDLKKRQIGIIGWIEMETKRKIPDVDHPKVLSMIGLVMHYYFDFLNRDYDTKSKEKYLGTTSYPEIMSDYLSLIDGVTETNYRKNNRIYIKHKTNPEDTISSLRVGDLLSYTRFIFDIPSAPISVNIDLVEEISRRMISGGIKIDPMNVDDTAFSEGMYQLVFQIIALTEKERDSIFPTENLEKAFRVVKSVLSSPNISIGIKFIMLSSLVNNERGSGSSIHGRLENTFKRLLKHFDKEMRDLIKEVFLEVKIKYLDGSRILYKEEENFFYTLYQGWSGSKDSIHEISKIRKAAQRKLKDYPEAIKLYWRKYPIDEEWTTLDDVFEGDRFFSMNDTSNPVYMPLKTLISVTKQSEIDDPEISMKLKFWEKVKDDPRLKEMAVIRDDQSTLRSYLIRNGFLDPEPKSIILTRNLQEE